MAEARAAVEKRHHYVVAMLLAAVLLPATLGSSQTIFNDGDVSWHIATGEWILDHRAVPYADPFSFTWAGRPWVPIEWLAETIMGGAYRLAGYSGIAALVTAALIALHLTAFLNATRFIRPFVALGALIAMDFVLIPMMLARPHLIAWPMIAFWTWLMLRAREKGRAPPLAAALLMVIWANLHGSFAMGLVIAGAFGLEALIAAPDRMRALREWAVFGLACAVAVFVNANGIEGVFHPLRIANLAMLPLIREWGPSTPEYTPWFFAILVATFVLLWFKRPRLSPVRWLLLGSLLALALLQMRHQAVLAIVAVMVLPSGFQTEGTPSDRQLVPLALAAAAALVVVRLVLPLNTPENSANPWKLIAAIPVPLRSQPVLNGYSMGGPLILSGIRPYIDGRGDMYGDALVLDYQRILDGDLGALDQAVHKWNIRWAILPNRSTDLIGLLDRTPGWRQIYKDQVGVIYVRN